MILKMKQALSFLKLAVFIALTTLLVSNSIAPLLTGAAGTANVSVITNKDSVVLDETVVMTIRINPNTSTVAGADIVINYDKSKLQPVSNELNNTYADFFVYPKSVSDGVITYSGGATGANITTTKDIANVTFKAIATGEVTFSFAGSTELINESIQNVTGSKTNKTISVVNKTVTPPAAQPPVSPPATPKTTPTPPPASTRPPGASPPTDPPSGEGPAELEVTDIQYEQLSGGVLSLSWKTSLEAMSWVEYGPDENNLLYTTSNTDYGTAHQTQLEPTNFIGISSISFRIASVDRVGNLVYSEVSSTTISPSGSAPDSAQGRDNNYATLASIVLGAVVVIIGAAIGARYFTGKRKKISVSPTVAPRNLHASLFSDYKNPPNAASTQVTDNKPLEVIDGDSTTQTTTIRQPSTVPYPYGEDNSTNSNGNTQDNQHTALPLETDRPPSHPNVTAANYSQPTAGTTSTRAPISQPTPALEQQSKTVAPSLTVTKPPDSVHEKVVEVALHTAETTHVKPAAANPSTGNTSVHMPGNVILPTKKSD